MNPVIWGLMQEVSNKRPV